MATNEELKKGQQLLKDQVEEVGYLDNAFKTLGATITSAIDDAIDSMGDMDDITKKIAKSYERDIVGSIKKSTAGLEGQVTLQAKINAGVNVSKEIQDKIDTNFARRQVTLTKINNLEGISNEEKRKLLGTANDVFKAEEKALKALKKKNIAAQKNKSLFTLTKEAAGGIADKIDSSGTLSLLLSKGIGAVLTPMRLLELAGLALFKALQSSDKQSGEMAKSMNLTYREANILQMKMTEVANASLSAKVTTEGLGQALMAVNSELGITNTTVDDNLVFFQEMHKYAGLTYEELKGVNAITNATGGDLKSNTGEILAQAKIQGTRLGVSLNEKEVLKDISKVSAATTVSLGMSADEIGKAVSVAKSLGLELGKVDDIAGSLLDFEQSIGNELEAELLLGKNLNLEKARSAALNNDLATVAEEIAKEAGTAAEFSKMNRIEQEALAGAVGMGREELAQMLFTQEQLVGLSGDEVALREKQINDLQAKGLSQDQIKAKLAKTSVDDLKKQVSVQENLASAVSKLKEVFISIAGPVLGIVSPIIDLLIPALSVIPVLLTPIVDLFQGMSKILTFNFEQLDAFQLVLGAIGVAYLAHIGYQKIILGIEAGKLAYQTAQTFLLATQKQGILGTIGAINNSIRGFIRDIKCLPLATNASLTLGVGVSYCSSSSCSRLCSNKSFNCR